MEEALWLSVPCAVLALFGQAASFCVRACKQCRLRGMMLLRTETVMVTLHKQKKIGAATVFAALIGLFTQAGYAQPISIEAAPQNSFTIPLKPAVAVKTTKASYRCLGDPALLAHFPSQTVPVTYINAGESSLAILPLNGQTFVFANVVAASGAKYAADNFVWWTKGKEAFFTQRNAGGAAHVTCRELQ